MGGGTQGLGSIVCLVCISHVSWVGTSLRAGGGTGGTEQAGGVQGPGADSAVVAGLCDE